ncbi:MAG TPA: hypothetical protein VFY85_02105 [Gemmatimonadaceae bacterium]|nr:hypothetical protein [Gemmatimonadaceae bacterium]
MSPGHPNSLRYLALLGAAGVVACGESHPTAPSAAPSSPATFTLSATDSAAFLSAVEDIRLRIVPTLGETERTGALRNALERVGDAVATRDRSALMSAVATSEQALAALAHASNEDTGESADLDAVRLVLLQANALTTPASIARDDTP